MASLPEVPEVPEVSEVLAAPAKTSPQTYYHNEAHDEERPAAAAATSLEYARSSSGPGQERGQAMVDEMGMRVRNSIGEESSVPRSPRLIQAPSSQAASIGTGTPGTATSSASSSQIPTQPSSQAGTTTAHRNQQQQQQQMNPPPTSYFNAMAVAKLNTDSVRSIESLSSFPSPPTHFPLPGMDTTTTSINNKLPTSLSQSMTAMEETGPGSANTIPFGLSTPALTDESGRSPQMNMMEPRTPPSVPSYEGDKDGSRKEAGAETETIKIKAQDLVSSTATGTTGSAGMNIQQVDGGASSSEPVEGSAQVRRVSGTGAGTGLMERPGSALSSNSIVASMRDKWSRAVRFVSLLLFLEFIVANFLLCYVYI